jgi:ubiquinone/menaquinone biosynthesis C-methylase UbiE
MDDTMAQASGLASTGRSSAPPENWDRAYGEQAAIYEQFSRCEDADDAILPLLFSRTSLAGKTVLEIGCGSGKYTRRLAECSGQYFALDVSERLLEIARRQCAGLNTVTFLQARAESIPLPDASVDAVFSSWALDGIVPLSSREQAIAECDRVLRVGGDIWVVGNHHTGAFMEMRGEHSIAIDQFGYRFMLQHGFEHVETIDTHFAFPSLAESHRILTFIFGDAARRYLEEHPEPRLGHRVVLLRRRKIAHSP